jgi:hypothetical protein
MWERKRVGIPPLGLTGGPSGPPAAERPHSVMITRPPFP